MIIMKEKVKETIKRSVKKASCSLLAALASILYCMNVFADETAAAGTSAADAASDAGGNTATAIWAFGVIAVALAITIVITARKFGKGK